GHVLMAQYPLAEVAHHPQMYVHAVAAIDDACPSITICDCCWSHLQEDYYAESGAPGYGEDAVPARDRSTERWQHAPPAKRQSTGSDAPATLRDPATSGVVDKSKSVIRLSALGLKPGHVRAFARTYELAVVPAYAAEGCI